MNIRLIASAIINRRNLSPVVMQGTIQDMLGPDGFTEALRLRWLDVNTEDGMIHLTNSQQKLDEMRAIVDDENAQVGDAVTVAEEGQAFQGTVQRVNPDGSVTLTFGDKKPKAPKPMYRKDEIRLQQGLQQTGAPPTGMATNQPSSGVSMIGSHWI